MFYLFIEGKSSIFLFTDVTRPKSRQPEAKGWKWGLDQSYKQTFQIKKEKKKQQVMELHILVTQWTIIGSHWKPGKNPWRLSFSDILPNALLSRIFISFCLIFWGVFVVVGCFCFCFFNQDHCFMLMQLLRRIFFNDWENLFTAPAYKESVQGQICLRYLTSKP